MTSSFEDQTTSSTPVDTSGRRVTSNALLNLSTGLLLLVLNLLVIPLLLAEYGLELFGVLSATWMILANLSWLDLGLSRATAAFVARDLGAGDIKRAMQWARASGIALLLLGLIGAAIILTAAPHLASALKVSPERQANVTLSLQIFALALPVDFLGRSLVGTLQAWQRFKWLNFNDLVNGIATVLAYGGGALLRFSFVEITLALLAVRLLTFTLNLVAVLRLAPSTASLPFHLRDALSKLRAMTRFGAWLSLSALLGALLLYFDRWMIGILIGVAALTYYAVPMGVLSRLFLFPQSVVTTLFPALSSLHSRSEWDVINDYFVRSHRYVSLMLAPAAFFLFVWSHELLALWISTEFAASAASILRILIVGFAIGLLAPLSGALLDASGRPDLIAKIYLVQVPLNIGLVYFLTSSAGVVGAALSFVLRCCFETVTIWAVLFRVLPDMRPAAFLSEARRIAPIIVILVGAAASAIPQSALLTKAAITAAALLVVVIWTLVFILDREDRLLLGDAWSLILHRVRP